MVSFIFISYTAINEVKQMYYYRNNQYKAELQNNVEEPKNKRCSAKNHSCVAFSRRLLHISVE